jgi:murein DD-endopeptidase MepM/ murein hydrolase activator NlpD
VSNPLNPSQTSMAQTALPRVASPTLQQASPIAGSAAGWTAQGGTPVPVRAGETASTLSARYGVPVAAITAANGGQVRPGQQAIIPIYNGNGGLPKTGLMEPSRSAAAPVLPPMRQQGAGVPSSVAAGEDESVSRAAAAAPPLNSVPASSAPLATRVTMPQSRPALPPLASAKPLAAAKAVKPEADDDDEDETPARTGRIVAAAPAKPLNQAAVVPPKPVIAAAKPLKPVVAPNTADDDDDEDETPAKVAEAAPKPAAPAARPAPAPVQPRPAARVIPLTPQAPAKTEEAPAKPAQADPVTTSAITPSKPAEDKAEFRWPARGRVISGFGSKGGNGDGIAIAVPEGTPVKSAGDGVVAYAGEELKGYGKLVLVRHDNGYVSAYAHNGDLNVKRGEKVSRGQTIAKSGSTGNVTSPQLHFELRKGSTPVDPTKYLEN